MYAKEIMDGGLLREETKGSLFDSFFSLFPLPAFFLP